MVELFVVDGITFRRYPDSPRRHHRVYYQIHKTEGALYLHRYLWQKAHGPIPAKHDIHHVDGNPLNNDLENLECLSKVAHRRQHPIPYDERQKRHLEKIRPLAAVWHGSEDGKAWHSEHIKKIRKKLGTKIKSCICCKKTFSVSRMGSGANKAKFCGGACQQKWNRDSGKYDTTRECVVCGKNFVTNRYQKARHCSGKCSGISGRGHRV